MTFNKLASEIAKMEGKKHQASVGDIREILALLSERLAGRDAASIIKMLIVNGEKRLVRRSKLRG